MKIISKVSNRVALTRQLSVDLFLKPLGNHILVENCYVHLSKKHLYDIRHFSRSDFGGDASKYDAKKLFGMRVKVNRHAKGSKVVTK